MSTWRALPTKAHSDADGHPVSAEDWLGNRFTVGDPVLYCVTAVTGGTMACGTVTKIRFGQQGRRPDPPIEVQVLRAGAAVFRVDEAGPRSKPGWINAHNVTAVNGVEQAVKKAVQ